MTLKLTSTKDVQHFVNIMVYGEAGVGKTTLCATAPNPLIISAEGGLLSLRKHDLPVFEVSSRDDVNDIYDWVVQSKEAEQYETICLDSLSEIGEVLLADEKKVNKDGRAAYGIMADELAVTIRGFRDLKKHVYFTCKLRKVVEEATGRITFMPSVPGQQTLNNLPFFFDEVFCLRIGTHEGKKYRYLQTELDAQYVAKDRSGVLRSAEVADLGYIIKTITAAPEVANKK